MTPLLSATLAHAAGLLIGLRSPSSAIAVWLLIALAMALFTRARRPIVLFCVAGIVVGALRARSVGQDCLTTLADGAAVRVVGVPTQLPAEGVTTPLRARITVGGAASGACDGVVRLRAATRHMALLDSAVHGHTGPLLGHGRWTAYRQTGGWPRRPQFAGSLLIDSLQVVPAGTPGVAGAGLATRFRAAQQARIRALLPERWGLAEALLLAQRAGLTPETRARWVAAGLVHLLAISGMHVGLIVAGMLLLGMWCRLSPRTARRAALALTGAYVLFLGAPTAALRALLQATLLLTAVELQRPAEPFTSLAAAGLTILVLEPLAILDPGFQLSFAGMVGLIGWRRPVASLLPARVPAHLRDGIAAGLTASALTTPIAALHFGTAAWIGIPATLLAVPLLCVALAVLGMALGWAAFTGATAGIHAAAADIPLRLLDTTAELAARVPGGHGYVAASTVLAALVAIAVAVIVRRALNARSSQLPPPSHAPASEHERWARRQRLRRLRFAAACAAALVVTAWLPLLLQPRDGRLEIHAIDVGQGDAFAVRTPAGRWLLVDAGPRSARFDAGRDRVVPFLLQRGVRRLDALILTHPDADHIGGAAAVLDAFDVGLVIDPGLAAGKDMFIDLLTAARRSSQRWVAGREGVVVRVDGVEIALLYPLAELDGTADANDNSLVFRLTFGDFAALFLGDAPESVEDTLVARHGARMVAAVLKVGHHGSNTSTGEALLTNAQPSLALISAGRNNRYGHPAPRVLQRLARHRVRVLRTDMHGDVTVRAARDGRVDVFVR